MKLTIERFCNSDMGVFGRMVMPDGQTLYTVERPWLDNQPRISCIPVGTYLCRPRRYNRGGYEAVEIQNVPSRKYILFHKANTMHDLAGCVGVVSRLGTLRGVWAGLDSKTAFGHFMSHFGQREFELEIKWGCPE